MDGVYDTSREAPASAQHSFPPHVALSPEGRALRWAAPPSIVLWGRTVSADGTLRFAPANSSRSVETVNQGSQSWA